MFIPSVRSSFLLGIIINLRKTITTCTRVYRSRFTIVAIFFRPVDDSFLVLKSSARIGLVNFVERAFYSKCDRVAVHTQSRNNYN